MTRQATAARETAVSPIWVTPAQILAAQTLVEMAEEDGLPVDEAIAAVAAAKPSTSTATLLGATAPSTSSEAFTWAEDGPFARRPLSDELRARISYADLGLAHALEVWRMQMLEVGDRDSAPKDASNTVPSPAERSERVSQGRDLRRPSPRHGDGAFEDLTNGDVVTTGGDKIGGIGQIYVDDNTGEPSWVTAKTGLFGTSGLFVPLEGANVLGGNIQVAYDKDKVTGAPRIDSDGNLSPEEEEQLYNYYGLGSGIGITGDAGHAGAGDRDADAGADGGADHGTTGTTAGYDSDRTVRHDTSGPITDEAMTLSEERLTMGTQTREPGRARLRKYGVTENVTQTVPVSREGVRVEREPSTDANIGDATPGPDISEDEHEVILHEERPVVETGAVPVERVRLETETETETATVTEEIRDDRHRNFR